MSAADMSTAGTAAGTAPVAGADSARVQEAEATLRRLLKSWRSRYAHIVLFAGCTPRAVHFRTEWHRRPTPHEPVPDVRVSVHFSFLYDTTYNEWGEKVGLPPTLSYRVSHEQLVRRDVSRSIDHHILRHIKFQSEFARRNPLPLTQDQAEYLDSRFSYEPLESVPAAPGDASGAADGASGNPRALESLPELADQASEDRKLERELIQMFQKADFDHNGSLDPEEFEDLLLNSKLGFSKEDVAVVMQQHDANADGKLVYREFISIAIDLVQAQRASAYAQTMTSHIAESAYQAALKRIKGARDVHRAMDAGIGALDPDETGKVEQAELAELLRGMDLDLSEGEIAAVISKLKTLNRRHDQPSASAAPSGTATPSRSNNAQQLISYKILQDSYEDLLLECMQNYQLDNEASDIELYLFGLFKKEDPENTGILDEKTLSRVLATNDRIKLSSTQIYAIVGDHKPIDGRFKYRSFARKAAHMLFQLSDSATVSERRTMIDRSVVTPIQLLSPAARARLERAMKDKFVEFDADNDGLLSPAEFAKCMSDTGLCLSNDRIQQLRDKADLNNDGMIDLQEFSKFAYETLLHLQRDAALKSHMTAALKQTAAAAASRARTPLTAQ